MAARRKKRRSTSPSTRYKYIRTGKRSGTGITYGRKYGVLFQSVSVGKGSVNAGNGLRSHALYSKTRGYVRKKYRNDIPKAGKVQTTSGVHSVYKVRRRGGFYSAKGFELRNW
jgi:hypothetical protein